MLDGATVLEDLDTQPCDIFSHRNEDIVRLSPEQLKARMAVNDALFARRRSRAEIVEGRPGPGGFSTMGSTAGRGG